MVTGGIAAVLCLLTALPASAEGAPLPHGRAAVLIDAASGQLLYEQNATDKNFPASTTKLLTALVAVEHGTLDQKITVSPNAVSMPPDSSSCYLEAGEQQPLEYLLYGLLLASGNDCATAIAEGVSNGRSDQFVTWMNETARRLGTVQSNFSNPHGLHEPDHYTSALDLALIARGALANPTIRKIAGTKEFDWPGKSERNGAYYNHNALLFYYPGATGGKTGYTEEAGLTLVGSASRDGRLLIGVVMGEESKVNQYDDMTALLDYGFTQFEQRPLITKGSAAGTVPVVTGKTSSVPAVAGGDFMISAPRSGQPAVTVQTRPDSKITAPVAAGAKLGVIEVREGDRVIGTVPLVAQNAVAARPQVLMMIASGTATGLKWLAYLLGGLLLFRITIRSTRRALRRSRASRRSASRYRSGNLSTAYRGRDR